jgi:hypothetical protein
LSRSLNRFIETSTFESAFLDTDIFSMDWTGSVSEGPSFEPMLDARIVRILHADLGSNGAISKHSSKLGVRFLRSRFRLEVRMNALEGTDAPMTAAVESSLRKGDGDVKAESADMTSDFQ